MEAHNYVNGQGCDMVYYTQVVTVDEGGEWVRVSLSETIVHQPVHTGQPQWADHNQTDSSSSLGHSPKKFLKFVPNYWSDLWDNQAKRRSS